MQKIHSLRLFVFVLALCFLAGGLNAFSLLYFVQTPSHHTGNITRLALTLNQGRASLFWEFLGVVCSYFGGATIAGFAFHDRCLKKRRDYIFFLQLCGLLLLGATTVVYFEIVFESVLLYTLALVLGLQNGMFLQYKGLLVRTTHMSGHVTDAAFYLGAALRGQKDAWQKSLFSLGSLAAFLVGGVLTTLAFLYLGLPLLFVFVFIYCLVLPLFLFC